MARETRALFLQSYYIGGGFGETLETSPATPS